ncbi:MAG: tRNA pseudouridine(13) synthase TruD, partial [Polyangiaceae bacterium]|nr:tRNA pseudouridine(13) synthase TruD [Polyangiaceae bacterium]
LRDTEDGFEVSFELPPGSYATVVLREILKRDADAQEKR